MNNFNFHIGKQGPIAIFLFFVSSTAFGFGGSNPGLGSGLPANPLYSGSSPNSSSDDTLLPVGGTGIDPSYRAILSFGNGSVPLPQNSWQIEYQFVVPALPASSSWSPIDQVFYIWGDLDFDDFGIQGAFPISHYKYNQIVPQLSIGNSLTGSSSQFAPSWQSLRQWSIQAQYYWQSETGISYAQTGQLIPVWPGDQVTTRIEYETQTGTIRASIYTDASHVSSIIIDRPFPNESLFANWTEFFARASATTQNGYYGRPAIQVESHFVDQATLCSVLPLRGTQFYLPPNPWGASPSGEEQHSGDFSCFSPLFGF